MNMKPTEDTSAQQPDQPQLVYYEPAHPASTMLHVEAAFRSRGYQVTTKDTADADAWVFVSQSGDRLGVDIGNTAADLAPLEQWSSATAYVTGIVDWIERTSAGAGIEPGARVVYYAPEHDEPTTKLIRRTLAERGYVLALPRLWWLDARNSGALGLHVDVDRAGGQRISHDDDSAPLAPLTAYLTPEDYALAIADWFDSDHTGRPEVPEPAAAEDDVATDARAAWIAGMRALCDLAEADAMIPLPDIATRKLRFTTSEAQADRFAVHLTDVEEEFRFVRSHEHRVTGKLAGVEVVVDFGCARTGVRV
jgi:hypothetical protein